MVKSPKSLQSQDEILLHSSSQGGEPLSTLVYTGPSFFKKPLSYSVVILSTVSNELVYPRNAPFQCFWSIRQLSWPVSQLVCNVLERSSEKADNYKLPCCWIDTMWGLELGLYSLPVPFTWFISKAWIQPVSQSLQWCPCKAIVLWGQDWTCCYSFSCGGWRLRIKVKRDILKALCVFVCVHVQTGLHTFSKPMWQNQTRPDRVGPGTVTGCGWLRLPGCNSLHCSSCVYSHIPRYTVTHLPELLAPHLRM